jgi:hypothetical protein
MGGGRYPWDFQQLPNYESAPAVPVEDAERLDARTFWRRYVLRNQPCLIKRAVMRWPAHVSWADADYVISTIGDVKVRASCCPRVEAFGLRSRERDAIAEQRTRDARLPVERVQQVLPRIRIPDDDVLFFEVSSKNTPPSLARDLTTDGARFSFLPAPPKPRHFYSGWAAMFYKNSYSDWHFHPGADAVMCQVLGTKDVVLLPPTQHSWDRIVPIHRDHWKVYDVDREYAHEYQRLRPYRVVVEPGDGLFLPVNWWHAVQARPREHGITVPVWWDSSYRDFRQPGTRHHLRVLWRDRKLFAIRTLLGTLYGTVASRVRDLTGREREPGWATN